MILVFKKGELTCGLHDVLEARVLIAVGLDDENLVLFARPEPRVQVLRLREREFKLPWREAGPPNHHDDKVDSDQ